jgi:pimeloyl-ACP methyl ester carboxylesterase
MNFDVPAAIGYVKKQTDADKITWIGHSMGGLLIYAYIGSFGQNDVDKIVTIGAPVRFHPLDKMSEIYMAAGTRLIPQYQGVPAEPIFKVIAAPMSKMPAISAWVLNPYNFSQDTSYRYMANSIPNLSGGTMRQIGRWAKTDRFDSMDGSIDYRAGLSKITVPALVMGGKLDNLAPTWATYPGYESIASADKSYVLLGQANGCREDHAHGGIVLGNWAKAEVYQVIQDWLDTQNTNAKGE